MWFVPIIGLAIALLVSSCGSAPKRPARQTSEKEEEGAESHAASAASQRCQELSTYGIDYVATCRTFVEKCIQQRKENIKECLEASVSNPKKNGALFYWQIPQQFRPSFGTYFAELLRRRAHSWIRKTPETERNAHLTLIAHGLLKDGEKIDEVFKGQVLAARHFQKGAQRLVIFLLDIHGDEETQEQVGYAVTALYRRGLRAVGAERFEKGTTFDNKDAPPRPLDTGMSLSESWLGFSRDAAPAIFGVDDGHLFEVNDYHNSWLMGAIGNNYDGWGAIGAQGHNVCEPMHAIAAFTNVSKLRSHAMWRNLNLLMSQRGTRTSALVMGAGHFPDFQSILEDEQVDYIVLAFPALERILLDWDKQDLLLRGPMTDVEVNEIATRGNACPTDIESIVPPSKVRGEEPR
jgi:hypothetical protein